MRNLIIMGLLAAVAAPTAVAAQSVGEVRRGEREVREQQRDVEQARRYGDRDDVREERRDVQDARQELREDRRDMRQAGNGPNRYSYAGNGPNGYAGNGPNAYRQPYAAPYRNWNYRPLSAGYRLQPAFWGPRYVIANPVQYRLPAVRRYQQWIRYGNDLVLVNVRNGRVIQVVRSRY